MDLIDKTKAAFKKTGRRVSAVTTAACGITFPRWKQKKKKKPRIEKSTIVVVRGSGELRRKSGVEDLREKSKICSGDVDEVCRPETSSSSEEFQRLVQQYHGVPHPSEEDVKRLQRRSISAQTSATSTQKGLKSSRADFSARIVEVDTGIEEDGGALLPAEIVRGAQRRSTVSRLPQALEQERRRGLVIDVDIPVPADPEAVDTAVSPTNISQPFKTPPETPIPWQLNQAEIPRPFIDLSSHRNTISSSTTYIEAQERWDSYIETLPDSNEAKRCSLHAVVSTDIARLVAELDVLHNRLAMANMRAAHRRRSTLDAGRPESWDHPISHTCSCGRRFELRVESEEQRRAKRRTWHAGSGIMTVGQRGKSESHESETRRDVMLRHSAGTTLFRHSLHGMTEPGDAVAAYVAEDERLVERKGIDFPHLE